MGGSNATYPCMSTTAIQRACELAGGQAALAKHLGVTPGAVYQWCTGKRPIPAERCPDIEQATEGQVRCEELRHDIAWDVLLNRRRSAAARSGRVVQ